MYHETRRQPHHRLYRALLCAGLILLFFAIRTHRISAAPLFIDEAILIHIAEKINDNSPFVDAWDGRLFSVWSFYAFQPFLRAPTMLSRAVVVMLQLIAMTALIQCVRRETGTLAALLSYLLITFSPYHHFFQRLGLADSVASAFQILAIALTWYGWKQRKLRHAVIIGLTSFIAFGAKINSIIFYPVPFAAWLTLGQQPTLRRSSFRWLAAATITASALAIALVLALSWIGQDFLSTFWVHSGSASSFRLPQIIHHAESTFHSLRSYLGTPLLFFALLAAVILLAQRRYFLPLITFAPLLAIWSVQTQQSRFWITPTTLLLIISALVMAEALKRRQTVLTILIILLLASWGSSTALPFLAQSYWRPKQLALPPADQYQYIEGESAGPTIRDLHEALLPLQPKLVLGIINNCLSLRYLALRDYAVQCPRVNYTGEDIPAHLALMDDHRTEGVYAVLDSTPFTPSAAPGTLLHVIPSPGAKILYSLYDLATPH